MLTKTKFAIVAAALLGFASSASAAPTRIDAYDAHTGVAQSGPAGYSGVEQPSGMRWADIYCTSCNLDSY